MYFVTIIVKDSKERNATLFVYGTDDYKLLAKEGCIQFSYSPINVQFNANPILLKTILNILFFNNKAASIERKIKINRALSKK